MTREELEKLIGRLEAGETGREMDARVHEHDAFSPDWKRWIVGGEPFGHISKVVPLYTTSLDAALQLVPEGWEWELSTMYGIARAAVGLNCGDGPFYGECKDVDAVRALVLAALKARASNLGG